MNDRQQRVFDALVKDVTMLRFEFDSSSQQMEDMLRKAKVPLSVKLHYKYKLPDNVSPQTFEWTVQSAEYVLLRFREDHILNVTKYYMDSFIDFIDLHGYNKDTVEIGRQRFADGAKVVATQLEQLNHAERQELANTITESKKSYFVYMQQLVDWLKKANPELRPVRVNTDNAASMSDFLQGVVYGFAPEDIDYFLNTDMNVRNAEIDEINARLQEMGMCPTYVIRPDRAQKILDSVLMTRVAMSKDKEL